MVFISLVYLVIVFTLLFYIKNDWCDLLFRNMTVRSEENMGADSHCQLEEKITFVSGKLGMPTQKLLQIWSGNKTWNLKRLQLCLKLVL